MNPSSPRCVGAAWWCASAWPPPRTLPGFAPWRAHWHPDASFRTRAPAGEINRASPPGAAVFCSPSISRTWHQTCLPPAQSAAPSLHTRGTRKTFMNFCCLLLGENVLVFIYVLKREILIQHPQSPKKMQDRSNPAVSSLLLGCLACLVVASVVNADGKFMCQ